MLLGLEGSRGYLPFSKKAVYQLSAKIPRHKMSLKKSLRQFNNALGNTALRGQVSIKCSSVSQFGNCLCLLFHTREDLVKSVKHPYIRMKGFVILGPRVDVPGIEKHAIGNIA
ncbi:hypothetical protein J6590_062651 [Homalodisca vitripennis]|nr:hypothetical protein J6590_062651 [Homalodisca vitripennis]